MLKSELPDLKYLQLQLESNDLGKTPTTAIPFLETIQGGFSLRHFRYLEKHLCSAEDTGKTGLHSRCHLSIKEVDGSLPPHPLFQTMTILLKVTFFKNAFFEV